MIDFMAQRQPEQGAPCSKRLSPDSLSDPLTLKALAHDVDLNVLWNEEDIAIPLDKGGCVIPPTLPIAECWPHWNTPLHRAIQFSFFDSADLLLRRGADINIYNSLGRTPLHEAVETRRYDAIQFLLARGADVNKITVEAHVRYEDYEIDMDGQEGNFSLLMALSISDSTCLKMLVEAGAGFYANSPGPWTILDLALLAEDRRAVKTLLQQGFELPAEPSIPGYNQSKVDHSDASRDLLALTYSENFVPLNELYETYCYALWKAKREWKSGHDGAIDDIEGLIRCLFEILEDATGPEQRLRKDKICSSCQKFQSEAFYIYETGEPFQHVLHNERNHLNDSADKGCSICGMIADGLDQAERNLKSQSKAALEQDSNIGGSPSPVVINIDLVPDDGEFYLFSLPVRCGKLRAEIGVTSIHDSFITAHEDHDKSDTNTGSAGAIHTAKAWLQACKDDSSHSICRKAHCDQKQSGTWPRRLLYVGAKEKQPNLVPMQDTQPPYCALSYCWGTKSFFITTRENLQQGMKSICLDDLPVMMQDAVSVTQALGYSYLWIDALCIIQNDSDDWEHEAANMHAIYSNADLTISSTVASDCQTGLFQPRAHRVMHPVPLDIWRPKSHRDGKSLAIYPEWASKSQVSQGPVHLQGWTLQQQLLSTRILWFSDGMLHWECLEGYRLEANPMMNTILSFNPLDDTKERINAKRVIQATLLEEQGNIKELPKSFQCFNVWKRQLEAFTRRRLTKPSDRLPAFISISRSLASGAGNKLHYGIWNGDRMLESLCWRIVSPLPKIEVTNLPSWTWAAVDGEISFDMVNRSGREDIEHLSGASVVSSGSQANDSLACIPASITLRATLRRKKPFHFMDTNDSEQSWLLESVYGVEIGVFLDYKLESLENCYAIDLLNFPNEPPFEGYGYPMWPNGRPPVTIKLLLQPTGEDLAMFRRVGIGIVPGQATDGENELGPDEKLTPLDWLIMDEETMDDREIIII